MEIETTMLRLRTTSEQLEQANRLQEQVGEFTWLPFIKFSMFFFFFFFFVQFLYKLLSISVLT